MARGFIVRPFGTKDGIDFERVERELIGPAMSACGIGGRTTGDITRQGNIREDMFRLLVTSDIVIADVSIDNANVFYELGIRHGLRDRVTFLLRGTVAGQKYPFDLQTDRYLSYDPQHPAAALSTLIDALRASLASASTDSPVFGLLPALRPHDRHVLMVVPPDFQEDVVRARSGGRRGDLRLLAHEARAFEWSAGGLRLVGDAQFAIKAFGGARDTFEALRAMDGADVHANFRLGTIYQKLVARASSHETWDDRLTKSEEAIARGLAQVAVPGHDAAYARACRAEGLSLLGSNAKSRWIAEWSSTAAGDRRATALRSPHLGASADRYVDGFLEDLNAYYPGINALAMLTLQVGLAQALPDVWAEAFSDDGQAKAALDQREQQRLRIASTLQLALGNHGGAEPAQPGHVDRWKQYTKADLLFLTSDRASYVGAAYRRAFAGASPFEVEAARRNLHLFRDLGLHEATVAAALAELTGTAADQPPLSRLVLFTGHMLDTPARANDPEQVRFPATPAAEAQARALIEDAVRREHAIGGGGVVGMAGAACGGDILFHEVCASLGIPTRVLLPFPPDAYQVASVNRGGPDWVERYRRLLQRTPPRWLGDSDDLPDWLVTAPGYDVWQRNNLWLMFSALAEDAEHLTLIALYNPERDPDGPGGTAHLVREAASRGFKPVHLDARALLT